MTLNPRDDDADPRQAQEAAWEAIVANYGDRPQWEDDPVPGPAAGPVTDAAPAPAPWPTPHPDHPAGHGRWRGEAGDHDAHDDGHDRDDEPPVHEERYVPPPPPPLPRTTPQRALAWFGLLGVPAVVLVLLVVGARLPSLVATGFAVWFVGGFAYLVASMRRGAPDDGPDDGAVV